MGMENGEWHGFLHENDKMTWIENVFQSKANEKQWASALKGEKIAIRFWIWIFKCNVLLSYNRLFLLRVQRKEKWCGGYKSLLLFSLNKSISYVDFIHIAREWRIDKKSADWKTSANEQTYIQIVFISHSYHKLICV